MMNEVELIKYLRRIFQKPSYLKTWLNDDCEILELEGLRNLLLITVDTSSEGIDFPADAPEFLIGYFCASLGLSDIAACGGVPLGILSSVCIPPKTEVLKIYDGIKSAINDAKTYLIGGDTNSSFELSISIVGIGMVEKEHIMRRQTAKVGDLVGVTGELDRFNSGFLSGSNNTRDIDTFKKCWPRNLQ